MQSLALRGNLFFVDSRTTHHSLAAQHAGDNQIPHASRDVFLDHTPTTEAIHHQFQRLIQKAHRFGTAIAIAHPHKETLEALEQLLPNLENEGIRLVTVSKLIHVRNKRSTAQWQLSSYHSRKAAKN